ncbi:oxalate/formate MFS antiporter, partial [Methylobacterium sp. J-090]|nr:oxalate/formate MFS antiporter [Methylobacterium sp. J-090]
LLVPVANYLQQATNSWDGVFLVAAGANVLASLLAIAVLKPWRKRVVAQAQIATETAQAPRIVTA